MKAKLHTSRRPPRTKGKISGDDDDADVDDIDSMFETIVDERLVIVDLLLFIDMKISRVLVLCCELLGRPRIIKAPKM